MSDTKDPVDDTAPIMELVAVSMNDNKISSSIPYVPRSQVTFSKIQIDDMDVKKELNDFYISYEDGYNQKHIVRQNTLSLSKPRIELPKIASFDRYFVCGICYKIFPTFYDHYTHKLIHEQSSNRDIHDLNVKSKHSQSFDKMYTCDICSFSCKYRSGMEAHKSIHSRLKTFKCNKRDYTSMKSGCLKNHIEIHSSEKPYKCDMCDFTCKYSLSLKTHVMNHHTGDKPFNSEENCYGSSISPNLKIRVHNQSQSGRQTFRCDKCQYRCVQSFQLQLHKLKHSSEKLFGRNQSLASSKNMTSDLRSCKEEVTENVLPIKSEEPDVEKCSYSEEEASQQNMTSDLRSFKEEFTENVLPIKSEEPDVEKCSYSEEEASQQNMTSDLRSCKEEFTENVLNVLPIKSKEPDLETCSYSDEEDSQQNMTSDLRSCKEEFTENVLPIRSEEPDLETCSYSDEEESQQVAVSTDASKIPSLSIPSTHEFTHPEIKILTCSNCDYTCTCSSKLNIHNMTHSDKRPYKSDKCHDTYKCRCRLIIHHKIHGELKPFKCDVCSYEYKESA